jgi:hypothetical protein
VLFLASNFLSDLTLKSRISAIVDAFCRARVLRLLTVAPPAHSVGANGGGAR